MSAVGRFMLATMFALAALQPAVAQTTSAAKANPWAFAASLYAYFPGEDTNFLMPVLGADHGWLHLEGRYNYEDRDTGSLWAGYNFGGGNELTWTLTPMIGGVFGNLDGVAAGYKGSLGWGRFELYSEGEYFIDHGDESENFFYNWSELSYTAFEGVRFGVVTQRTQAYQSDRDLQRGLLAGYSTERWNATLYVFNPDESKPTVVLGLGATF